MAFDLLGQEKKHFKTATPITELKGKLKSDFSEDKLMHSVLEADKDTIDDSKIICEGINQGMSSFTPDLMFENLVKNYNTAKHLYGETIIRELTGYDPNYVKKNINIPEFRKKLKEDVQNRIEAMQQRGFIDKNYFISRHGFKAAGLIMYMEELDRLITKGIGKKEHKRKSLYGDKKDLMMYHKARYRDIAIRATVKTAIRRKHKKILQQDLRLYDRQTKGKICIIYGVDSSGSMRGNKLATAKKAGIALAFKAIQEKNDVGLIVFGSKIKKVIEPCQDFKLILNELAAVRSGMETNIANTIQKALELFPKHRATKHLILLTDALPTKGKEPEKETMRAVSLARNNEITISLLGMDLDKKGLALAKKIVEVGQGRLYICTNLEEVDKIVLQDYYELKR